MKLIFHIHFHTVWGQRLCLIGSIPELGAWETGRAREMDYTDNGNWQLSLEVAPETKNIAYRYFLKMNNQHVLEEWNKNHSVVLNPALGTCLLYDYWQIRPSNLAFYSSAFTKSLFARPCDAPPKEVNSRRKLILKVWAPRVEKNQSLAVAGNQVCLGLWQPEKAPILRCRNFPEWEAEIDADAIDYPLEYKFLTRNIRDGALACWESGENRLLHPPPREQKQERICVSGLFFRDSHLPPWKAAGCAVPVFSLRSANSFGTGDLGDLRLFIDWVKKTGQRLIQLLPVNDTTATHTWTDSYPYKAVSIFALHPMYIDLAGMGPLNNPAQVARFAQKQKELNALQEVDYEAVMACKTEYCRLFFEQEGRQITDTESFARFVSHNQDWLVPYAAYVYLRDTHQTADFSQWGSDAVYRKARAQAICSKENEAYPSVAFTFFLQFVLHTQFQSVSEYARQNGIVLKGDLPIGVNRHGVEVWTEPSCFHCDAQAGAPPDDFSPNGQNWTFPTYHWEKMEQTRFAWWKKRFDTLSAYFDCLRIDHILGFFRIWEIPPEYTQGLCGHFNPALPLSKEEIEGYGLSFNEKRFTRPHIHRRHLPELFGPRVEEITDSFLAQSSSNHFVLKPFCDTQAKIEALFAGKTDEASLCRKNGLLGMACEVLFLCDPYQGERFHPRISASQSFLYRELSPADQYAFDHLCRDFFYRRHSGFWKEQACKRLTPLMDSTTMLICGEDLGMIPESVPEVMSKLQILSLEVERMPKQPGREFSDLRHLPYLCVCTTSTHDMSPLRSWWEENREKTQRYYNQVLQLPGEAPGECSAALAEHILARHLEAPSMLTIIPLQDWLAADDRLKRKDGHAERINVPANATHYWRYRMHVTIEELLEADSLNEKIISLIRNNGRR
ncbi:MAG: 4-alpha-glucanotransferase [Tannerellaceae bacterium]|jgi:4-alpha-glucanotransferase|nr:4-alpha-glucanotransferase [Tannerellaceae bacterium]